LPRYLINSAILKSGKDPKICAEGAIKMLAQKPVKGIELKSCYCCANENRVAFIMEGPSQDAVLETVQEHLNVPVASIMEAEEVT
jgi:hypothetical protein